MARDNESPRFFGRYQVLEELGAGAMGVVYLCVDARLARPVAVKVVKDAELLPPAEREQYLARFRQEAEAAGRLSHPDIVQVYDVGPTYLVMEFVEGRPLSEVLRSGPALDAGEVARIVLRVGEALDYAHRQGIVHRDVKPANIMRLDNAAGGVKVMDFGVARLPSSTLTALGAVVGSVRYMAPEQMLGRVVDGRADVFSLGAVAYELLTGQPPYPGKTATEVVARVVHGRYVPARAVEPRLPAACDDVFARVFAPDPEQRYTLGADFARALQAATSEIADLCLRSPEATGGAVTGQDTTHAFDRATALAGAAPASEPTTVILTAPGAVISWLEVLSEPEGARVSLDGQALGATPLARVPLGPGAHRVTLELAGHLSAALEVVGDPAAPFQTLSLVLRPEGALSAVAGGPGLTPPRRLQGETPRLVGALRAGEGNTLAALDVVVGADGRVAEMRAVAAEATPQDEALARAVAGWRFAPAERDGSPVAARVRVTHRFEG